VNLIRRLLPPAQTAACSGCGRVLRERWRAPCPQCGDTRRTVGWTTADAVGVKTKF
jgi:RNA polymerase subunit RPABC4/transcription elongation factor Spt4